EWGWQDAFLSGWLHGIRLSGAGSFIQLEASSGMPAGYRPLCPQKLFMTEKDVVRAYVDAFNRGDLEGVCRQFAPDALIWGMVGFGGVEQARAVWKDLIESLEVELQVERMVAEGNTVAVRYTERGTAVKPYRGMAATGKSDELVAMEWCEVKDGLIHRRGGRVIPPARASNWGGRRGGAVAGRDSLRIAGRGSRGDGCAPDMLAAFFISVPFVTLGAA
ncbi:MAG: nuclear transport factor 2 family protein, partial [Acidobacteriaceae bacterium]